MKRVGALGIGLALLWATAARAADTVYYYYTDEQGSPEAVTDSSGNVIERSQYAPYGEVLNRPEHEGPGYTGHEEDSQTGLTNMQQRYGLKAIGRMLSTDPVDVDPTTGANFNRYAYAEDNPYRYTDPDGRCTGSLTDHCGSENLTIIQIGTPSVSEARANAGLLSRARPASPLTTWPVPGHYAINQADKPGEGDGHFGAYRNTSRGPSTHEGVDIQAPEGSAVVAAGNGAVSNIQPNPSRTYGNQIVINHGDGIYTQYAHLAKTFVSPGDSVYAGQIIGAVGRTGNTPRLGDAHLHFEVRIGSFAPRIAGGFVVDPLTMLPPQSQLPNQ